MRLSRNLFYALMLLFIAGIILICLVDAASVWSRIAAGLVTGSFVGAVNTLVNYFHQQHTVWFFIVDEDDQNYMSDVLI